MKSWVPKIRIAELVSPDGTSRVTFGWFDLPSGDYVNQDVTVTRADPGHAPTVSFNRVEARRLWLAYLKSGYRSV